MSKHDTDQEHVNGQVDFNGLSSALQTLKLSNNMSATQHGLSPELGDDAVLLRPTPIGSSDMERVYRANATTTSYDAMLKKISLRGRIGRIGTGRIVMLAPEIIANIMDQLASDQCVFNLRLTCKTMEALTRHQFLRRFFTETYHMWAKWSLKELRTLATAFPDIIRVINLAALTARNVDDSEWRGTQHQRLQYDVFMKEESGAMWKPGSSHSLHMQHFRKALAALPNLRTIRITALIEYRQDKNCMAQRLHPAAQRLCDRSGAPIKFHVCPTHRLEFLKDCINSINQVLAKNSAQVETLEFGCMSLETDLARHCALGPCCIIPVQCFMTNSLFKQRAIATYSFDAIKHFSAQLMLECNFIDHRQAARIVHSMKNLITLRLSLVTPYKSQGHLNTFFATLVEAKSVLQDVQIWAKGTVRQSSLDAFLAHVKPSIKKLTLSTMTLIEGTWLELFEEKCCIKELDGLNLIHVAELDPDDGGIMPLHHVNMSKKEYADLKKRREALTPCPNLAHDPEDDSMSAMESDMDSEMFEEMYGMGSDYDD